MQNQLELKKSKQKLVYLVICILIGLVVLGMFLFYYYPLPQNLKKISQPNTIQRCVYNEGLGYKASYYFEGFIQTAVRTVMYNARGEELCSDNGLPAEQEVERCSTLRLCFPIYDH